MLAMPHTNCVSLSLVPQLALLLLTSPQFRWRTRVGRKLPSYILVPPCPLALPLPHSSILSTLQSTRCPSWRKHSGFVSHAFLVALRRHSQAAQPPLKNSERDLSLVCALSPPCPAVLHKTTKTTVVGLSRSLSLFVFALWLIVFNALMIFNAHIKLSTSGNYQH